MEQSSDVWRIAEEAVAEIVAPAERGALAAMVVGALLRVDPVRGIPRLDVLPAPLRKMALLRVAQGGAPSPELAARARAEVATWTEHGDDEAAFGLWAGLGFADVGADLVPAPARELDRYQLGKRLLGWGVPADWHAAVAWLDAHLEGRGQAALAVMLIERRTLPAELGPVLALVERLAEPLFRLDGAAHLCLRGATSVADEARLVPTAQAAFDKLPPAFGLHPAARAKRAVVEARALPLDAGKSLDQSRRAFAGAIPSWRPDGLRWMALAHARLGLASWRAFVEQGAADASWFAFKEQREPLLVDALGAARHLPELTSSLDAVHEVFREVLRRLRDPLWKALGASVLVPLSAAAAGRFAATAVAELVPLLRVLGADPLRRDALGGHLAAIVERVGPHAPDALREVIARWPDPTLRAFGAIHLAELTSSPRS